MSSEPTDWDCGKLDSGTADEGGAAKLALLEGLGVDGFGVDDLAEEGMLRLTASARSRCQSRYWALRPPDMITAVDVATRRDR